MIAKAAPAEWRLRMAESQRVMFGTLFYAEKDRESWRMAKP